MTIKRRLNLNAIFSVIAAFTFCGIYLWSSNRYVELQNHSLVKRAELEAWYGLHAEVSYYLKERLEDLVRKDDSEQKEENHKNQMKTILSSLDKVVNTATLDDIESADRAQHLIDEMNHQFEIAEQEEARGIRRSEKYFVDSIDKYDEELYALVSKKIHSEAQQAKTIKTKLDALKTNLDLAVPLLTLIIVLGCVISIRRINSTILHSVDTLHDGISEISSGNLNHRIQVSRGAELGKVGQAFNKMIDDLKHSQTLVREQQKKMVVTGKMSALGEMAGGVAHEINNPLAVIRTISEQLQEYVQDDSIDKPGLIEMVGQIEITVDRIAKIISGLRSFSRDSAKDPKVHTDIVKTIDETLSFCRERFRQNDIKLIVEGMDQPIFIPCRGVQISQVVLNLLNNAYDAVLNLPQKWVHISVAKTQDSVEIRIRDSGQGIPETYAAKLFQPFFTTKGVGQGTGLGLSISKGIVEEHDGTLFIDSKQPNTCFVIRLPIAEKMVIATTAFEKMAA